MNNHVHSSDLQPRSSDGKFSSFDRPEVEVSDLAGNAYAEERIEATLDRLDTSMKTWRDPMGQRDIMTGLNVEIELRNQFPDIDQKDFFVHAVKIYDTMDKLAKLEESSRFEDIEDLCEEADITLFSDSVSWRRDSMDESDSGVDFDQAHISTTLHFEDKLAEHVTELEKADRQRS